MAKAVSSPSGSCHGASDSLVSAREEYLPSDFGSLLSYRGLQRDFGFGRREAVMNPRQRAQWNGADATSLHLERSSNLGVREKASHGNLVCSICLHCYA
jgi:hypothetical protein